MTAQPEWWDYLRTLLALAFVAGLIFLLGFFVKKSGIGSRLTGKGAAGNLSVVETLYLDPRHRLVLVRCREKEHLLLLGAVGDLRVDSDAGGAGDAAA